MLINKQSLRDSKSAIIVSVLGLGAADVAYRLTAAKSIHGPSGGSLVGLIYGGVGTVLIAVTMLLMVKKAWRTLRIGSAYQWLQWHVWIGLITYPIIGYHAGWHWGGPLEASVLDIVEQSATGRILEYVPSTKATRIVAKGLTFANGVALSHDEQTLFVSETGKYRVWKIPVVADKLDLTQAQTQASLLLEELPGYPDNLMRGSDGKIWLGLAGPRSANVDKMADKPFLRRMTMRLPRSLWPVPKAYGHVMAFTEDGRIIADLQDPSGDYAKTTGVTETSERLYIQSLSAKGLGWLAK